MTRLTSGYSEAWRSASPDLRRFLVATAAWNAFSSLFWVDFGPYVLAIGITPSDLGLIMAASSLAAALTGLPAGLLADAIGRRPVLLAGQALATVSLLGLAMVHDPLRVALLAAGVGAGSTCFFVVGPPFLSENSEGAHRDRFFAAYFAIGLAMGAVAPILAAAAASAIATSAGDTSAAGPYRLLVLLMAGLSAGTLAVFATLGGRAVPRTRERASAFRVRELLPSTGTRRPFLLILVTTGLVALGAGQLIPFLNVFVQRRFELDVFALNVIFAVSSLGTLLATLAQPWLAARLGRVHAVVALQVASLPFIVVLGWSSWLPLVVVALVVRNTLMNAGNPLYQRFAMDQVPAEERARLSGAMQVLWSSSWVAGAVFYGAVQAALGFDRGYALAFTVTLTLYGLASLLLWRVFARQDVAAGPEGVGPGPVIPAAGTDLSRAV